MNNMSKKIYSIRVHSWDGVEWDDCFAQSLVDCEVEGLAIAHSKILNRSVIFDVASGLMVYSSTNSMKRTKEYFCRTWLTEERIKKINSARNTLMYKQRCLELESHKMYV